MVFGRKIYTGQNVSGIEKDVADSDSLPELLRYTEPKLAMGMPLMFLLTWASNEGGLKVNNHYPLPLMTLATAGIHLYQVVLAQCL